MPNIRVNIKVPDGKYCRGDNRQGGLSCVFNSDAPWCNLFNKGLDRVGTDWPYIFAKCEKCAQIKNNDTFDRL